MEVVPLSAHSAPAKGFMFVTTSHPDEFKDRFTMTGVRSHAMLNHVQKKRHKKLSGHDKTTKPQSRAPAGKSRDTSKPSACCARSTPNVSADRQLDGLSRAEVSTWIQQPSTPSSVYGAIPSVAGDDIEEIQSVKPDSSTYITEEEYSSYSSVICHLWHEFGDHAKALKHLRPSPVPSYRSSPSEERSDGEPEEELSDKYFLGFAPPRKQMVNPHNGTSDDPCATLPDFKNSTVSVWALKRRCTITCGIMLSALGSIWVPMMLQNRHSFLSSVCINATSLDIRRGLIDDSPETLAVKVEAISEINAMLLHKEHQASDSTIMSVVHVLCNEIPRGDEMTLLCHLKGLELMVTQRGGMSKLGGKGCIAAMVTCVVFDMCIVLNRQPHTMFTSFVYTTPNPSPMSNWIPESPLYCPRSDIFSLKRSRRCVGHTYEILCDMRDLTTAFLQHCKACPTVLQRGDGHTEWEAQSDRIANYETIVSDVHTRLLALPSAEDVGSAVEGDNTYETIRLTALIYSTAIAHNIPLHSAVATVDYLSQSTHSKPSILLRLLAYLVKTDMSDLWGDMAGVFLWVSLVGGAASWQTPEQDLRYVWARRCLNFCVVRASVLLGFEHSVAVLTAQRQLLKVMKNLDDVA